MDLTYSDPELAFRDEVRAWLIDNVPTHPLPPPYTAEGVAAHREWEKALYTAGYSALHWPQEFGGGGADFMRQMLFDEEYHRAAAPQRLNRLALGLVGPTLIEFGTTEQKRRWLPGMLSCDELWCQGFSEPGAGSDLSAVRTRAVPDGDDFVLNGQKIWTSLSAFADWMFALVRTDPSQTRHRGLTYIVLPMNSAGIELRPIRQLHGEPGFSEVFFTDVRVPAKNVIGEIGDGWRVAMATLGYERGTGLGNHVRLSNDVRQLVDLAKRMGVADDPVHRNEIASRFAEAELFRRYMQHIASQLAAGNGVGFRSSLVKLYWSELDSRIQETALQILGPFAELAAPQTCADGAGFHRRYWHARASRIFAGTNEIQRNIIGERLLGLPREPR
jgi:alkylation response protein AidB-like acyl-CoA dehydrogenase